MFELNRLFLSLRHALILSALIGVFSITWVLQGCHRSQNHQRTLVLGLSADYPPFEFKKNGEIVGFDVDVARKITEELGYQLEIQDMDFGSLIPSLQSGRVDFVMSGMAATEERLKNVLFSSPYYDSSFVLISPRARQLTHPLAWAGKHIGVQLGSTLEAFAKEKAKSFSGMEVVSLGRFPTLIQELKSGRLDGVIAEEGQALSVVQLNAGLEFVALDGTGDGYAVAFAQGRESGKKYQVEFNQVLKKLKKTSFLDQLKTQWLGHAKVDVLEHLSQKSLQRFYQNLTQTFLFVAKGIHTTLLYTLVSAVGGFVLGLTLALLKVGPFFIGKKFADFYTSVFRGTPMLVQLSLVYFGAPSLLHYKVSPLVAGIIAFSLNSGAYVSELIRAGIQGIDAGQYEAAQALDIPYFKMMKDIILPQAIRNVLPALVNEVVNLLKETALVSTLGEADIMRQAQVVAAETYSYFEPLLIAAGCYYVLILCLNFLAKKLERTLAYASR